MPFPILGIFAAGGGADAPTYWLSLLGGASTETGYSVALDTSGAVYVAGSTSTSGAGGLDGFLAKYDNKGNVAWQRSLGGSSSDNLYTVQTDSSGNVYVSGNTSSIGSNGTFFLAKYNSAGTLQWQNTLSSANTEDGGYLAVDSSGNCYIAGSSNNSGAGFLDVFLAKFDTNGTIQWQRTYGHTSSEYVRSGRSIALNSNGDVIIHYNVFVANYGQTVDQLIRIDSSGTLQSTRICAYYNTTAYDVTVAPSNVYYFVSYAQDSRAIIQKINTNFTASSLEAFSASGLRPYSITHDSSGNVYMLADNGADILIAKFNSSLVLQWQRVLYSAQTDSARSIIHDGDGALYLFGSSDGTSSGNFSFFLAKLPDDGTLTGTYNVGGYNYTYANGSYGLNAGSRGYDTETVTTGTATLTVAAGTLTGGTPTLTATFKQIG